MIPRPAQPTPGSGPPDSTQIDIAETDFSDVVEFHVLAFRAKGVEHGLLRQPSQQQPRGIRLGIAAHNHDLSAHFRQTGHCVLRGGGLSDTAFAVNGNLSHLKPPVE